MGVLRERGTDDAMRQIVANAKKLKEQIGVRNFGSSLVSPLINSDVTDNQNYQKNTEPAVFKLTPSFVTRKRPLDREKEPYSKKSKPAANFNPIPKPSEKPRLIEEPPDGGYEDARDFTEKIPR